MLSIWECIWGGGCPHLSGLKNLACFVRFLKVWSCVEHHQMHGKNIAFVLECIWGW